MPRLTDDAATAPSPQNAAQEMTKTLKDILLHLERMDKRDKLRTWGGFVRSMIAMIPLILTVWGIWYFYANMDKILSDITEQAARKAAEYSKSSSEKFLEDIKGLVPGQ